MFIDSSKRSLKAVLLYNSNTVASLPIAQSVTMKETYDNLKTMLVSVKYDDHKWLICGDLKVIAIILGLQGGYSKFPCFSLPVGQSSRFKTLCQKDVAYT